MSEIRRRDRRAATPWHILYQAMKILRFRVRDGIQNMFRCLRPTETITREQVEDRIFVERLIDSNQCFLTSIPNPVQKNLTSRKKDVFAMMRQLGTPNAFLTMSANETRWPHLIRTLHRLSKAYKCLGDEIPLDEIFEKLDTYERAHLVAEDPVVCAIIFYRAVTVFMSAFCTKRKYNPFGQYRVVDYWWSRDGPDEEFDKILINT